MIYKPKVFCLLILLLLSFLISISPINSHESVSMTETIIADHTIVNKVRFDQIPDTDIINAKSTLHIAYGHTSHGSQIITGMNELSVFKESQGGIEGLYDWNEGGADGALDIDDYFVSGDLGNPDLTTWADRTESYLDNIGNLDVNVVMWSWCGQVSSASEQDINTYLTLMSTLETSYPNIHFVYMTGHTDGTGLEGNLHIRNNQIRNYCLENGKILFDFADIESYDPDGCYFGDKFVNDNCAYHNDTYSGNWALEWQETNPDGWYNCSSAHSQPLNANLKAYAAWWMFARIAGWNDTSSTTYSANSSSTGTSNSPEPTSIGIIWIVIGLINWTMLKKKREN